MRGKNKCKILKEIRQKIADENDIPYVTSECTYQGECSGTCPRCEAELRYLEQQLEKRQRMGKRVTVAALAASLTTGLVGCPDGFLKGNEVVGKVPYYEAEESTCELTTQDTQPSEKPGVLEEETQTAELIGEVESVPETDDELVLEGDVAYYEPSQYFETTAGVIAVGETDTVEVFTEENDG